MDTESEAMSLSQHSSHPTLHYDRSLGCSGVIDANLTQALPLHCCRMGNRRQEINVGLAAQESRLDFSLDNRLTIS